MQNLFKEYVSNTVAGTSNNYILKLDAPKKITGRIYVKVNEYGEFDYRFFFSNNVDSTFADGAVAHAGLKGGKWEIISAFAGVSNTADPNSKSITFLPVTFNSETKKEVYPGEMFWSDCVKLDIKPEQYLFFEWTVFGNNIPFTPDKIVESFVKTETGFTPCVDFAQPHLFGCNRLVKKRIAFFGDSITQGLGTRDGLYEFWVAKIAQTLGNDYSVWNLGLGYGRAQDAAQNLSWTYKAKQADLVSVCFGVNDILQGRTANQICADLKTIVTILKSAGCEVGIFTVPPFSIFEEDEKTWRTVNLYIKTELASLCNYVFDTVKSLGKPYPNDNIDIFGGHPDADGCTALAADFCKQKLI